jgi:hypothetical protein
VLLRCLSITIALLLFAPELSSPALAGSAPKPAQEQRGAESFAIVEDEEAKAFRFLIDGREVARLDAAGLHVRNSIEYGGSITDTGTGTYDEHAAIPEGAPDEDAP